MLQPRSGRPGRVLDVGEIELDPTGVLDLAVTDRAGEPVGYFRIECGGRQGFLHRPLGEKEVRYLNLPLCRAGIKISAADFREKELTVVLEPGRPAKVRVVLERR